MTGKTIKVGIVGGTGYTGVELLRLLAQHPQVELHAITSRKEAGMPVAEMFPSLRGRVKLAFSDPAQAPLTGCDVVFFATPHGVAMAQAPELLAAGVKLIDLAADFRLKDTAEFERWYKMPHSCTDILAEAVYGLPEVNREAIRKARVIGLPGCYPTSVQLGLLPVLDPEAVRRAGGDLIDPSSVIADCKSGVSGAGRKAEVHALLFIAGEPLPAEEIMERLRISRGSVSTTLKQLTEWGLVQRVRPKDAKSRDRADRREFHQAEQDVWKLFYTILRARKRREFDPLIEELGGCRVAQKGARRSDRQKAHDQRIDELLELCRFFDGLANTVSKSGKGIERATKILSRVLGGPR